MIGTNYSKKRDNWSMLVLFYETILKLRDLHNLERRFFAEILKAMLRLYRNLSMDLLLIWY